MAPASLGGLWPDAFEPDLTDVDVAIARTVPPSESEPAIRECERLFVDSIAAARQSIYIESQYFTNDALAGALAARLQEPEGPEIIVVIPKECHGWVEQQTMGALRAEALRHLIAGDRWRRLRVVYPAASRARDVCTFIHSKVMIVDDRFVRIGSANFSRRSMGVDSECDLAIDAGSDPAHRAGVQRIRDRLIAEHLGVSADAVTSELGRVGSLRALVDARAHADRALCRVDLGGPAEPPSEVLKAAADPDEPFGVLRRQPLSPGTEARAFARGGPALAAAVSPLDVVRATTSPGCGVWLMPPRSATLRVATYNVHACVGTDGRHDPDRVAAVVGELDADVVALQEFTYPASVAIESRVAVELVALDRYQCALGPTRQVATRCFGNALLARHPIVDVHRIDLSMDRREPRGALATTIDVDGIPVHLLATHLGLRVGERRFQVTAASVVSRFRAALAGDRAR